MATSRTQVYLRKLKRCHAKVEEAEMDVVTYDHSLEQAEKKSNELLGRVQDYRDYMSITPLESSRKEISHRLKMMELARKLLREDDETINRAVFVVNGALAEQRNARNNLACLERRIRDAVGGDDPANETIAELEKLREAAAKRKQVFDRVFASRRKRAKEREEWRDRRFWETFYAIGRGEDIRRGAVPHPIDAYYQRIEREKAKREQDEREANAERIRAAQEKAEKKAWDKRRAEGAARWKKIEESREEFNEEQFRLRGYYFENGKVVRERKPQPSLLRDQPLRMGGRRPLRAPSHKGPVPASNCGPKVPKPSPQQEWKWQVDQCFADYSALQAFPAPPPGCCDLAQCKSSKDRKVKACEHDIRRLFLGIKGLDLRRERQRWHPDKFSVVTPDEKRVEFQAMATEIFVVIEDMYQKSRNAA